MTAELIGGWVWSDDHTGVRHVPEMLLFEYASGGEVPCGQELAGRYYPAEAIFAGREEALKALAANLGASITLHRLAIAELERKQRQVLRELPTGWLEGQIPRVENQAEGGPA